MNLEFSKTNRLQIENLQKENLQKKKKSYWMTKNYVG